MSKTRAARTYPRPRQPAAEQGGTMAEGIIDAVGRRLTVDLAVHGRGRRDAALGSLATGIVGPMLEAADSVGWTDARRLLTDRAARLRRVVDKAVGKP